MTDRKDGASATIRAAITNLAVVMQYTPLSAEQPAETEPLDR
jgi:hypothetical protein